MPIFVNLLTSALCLGHLSLAFAQLNPPCGAAGSLTERISDCDEFCSVQSSHQSFYWTLVTRTKAYDEIWLDRTNGTLWSAPSRHFSDLSSAHEACEQARDDQMFAGIRNFFKLPTVSDFRSSLQAGMQSCIGLPEEYWTGDLLPPNPYGVVFDPFLNITWSEDHRLAFKYICISQI